MYAVFMSAVQVKRVIDKMSGEDRFFALAYLKHLVRRDDPSHQKLLGDRVREMDRGKKISLASVKRLHKQLDAAGL
jgi:hypothetical protein